MGKTCHLILQALEERSTRTIEREILNFKPRPYSAKEKSMIANKIKNLLISKSFFDVEIFIVSNCI